MSDTITCPSCNHEIDRDDLAEYGDSGDIECSKCEFKFRFSREVTYSVTCNVHQWEQWQDGCGESDYRFCQMCGSCDFRPIDVHRKCPRCKGKPRRSYGTNLRDPCVCDNTGYIVVNKMLPKKLKGEPT